MAKKNSMQIAYLKEIAKLKKTINQNVPEIYACFIKVMYEKGMSFEEIEDIVIGTQTSWNENVDRMDTMIDWCLEVTGIDVKGL